MKSFFNCTRLFSFISRPTIDNIMKIKIAILIVLALLSPGCNPNLGQRESILPLRNAVEESSLQGVQDALEITQNINEVDENAHHSTALHGAMAADTNKAAMAKLLIAAGADVNSRDDRGETPIFWLVNAYVDEKEFLTIAKILKTHGANFDLKDNAGETLVAKAKKSSRPDLAKDLVKIFHVAR
ncbi:MAG: ankyrin repeat domain-containing protein [Capsulimonas sp.]|uniref:ankyrin repeat domain-containing protein n=1 Tax=Capsulimonas sp. TaxID=2494211 RepID=UPI003266A888